MTEFFIFIDFLNIYINSNYNLSIFIFFIFLLIYNILSIPGNLIFAASAGFHLTETPLTENQILIKQDNGNYLLKTEVHDTSQLRWWLLGFGSQVEVIKPLSLRKEFKEIAYNSFKMYQ